MRRLKNKILALLLVMVLGVSVITPYKAQAADTSYKTWLQTDSGWGSIHLGSSSYTMASSGCLVTTIAILMCHSGSASASSFTPATLVNYLNNHNGFTSGGSLYWAKVEGAVSNFTLVNYKVSLAGMTQAEKTAKMAYYLNQGDAVVISVRNGGHWVALDRIDGDTVYMMDPGTGATKLYDQYNVAYVDRLAVYKGAHACGTTTTSSDSSSSVTSASGTGTVNCSSLYIRKGAGTGYSVVTAITKGTKVTIKGVTTDSNGNKWYQVTSGSYSGYCSASYITLASTTSSSSDITLSSTSSTSGKTGTINCTALNVRKGAGTSYSIVTTLAKGAKVTIKGETTDSNGTKWYQVTSGSYTGYVSASYVTVASSTTTSTTTTTTTTASSTTTGTIYNCTALYVRKGAGTSYSAVTTLKAGTTVTIKGETTDSSGKKWYQITSGSYSGYCSAAYVKTASTATASSSDSSSATASTSSYTAKVTTDALNVRKGAGTSNSVVTTITKGQQVTVTGESKDSSGTKWYKITFTKSGTTYTGYASASYITAVSASSSSDSSSTTTATTTTATSTSEKGVINTDALNIRKDAGTSYAVVTTLTKGTAVTITGSKKDSSGNVWYKITSGSYTGYAHSAYVTKSTASGTTASASTSTDSSAKTTGTVNTDWLNVRKSASSSASVLVVIPEGTKVTIASTEKDSSNNSWYKVTVSYGGSSYTGYCSASYITK